MMKIFLNIVFTVALALLFSPAMAEEDSFAQLLNELGGTNLSKKATALDQLAQLDDERVLPTLEALMNNALYQQKSDNQFVFAESVADGMKITSVVSGAVLGETVSSRDLRKIITNNSLRSRARNLVAATRLMNKKAEVREAAALELIKSPNIEFLQPLDNAIAREKVPAIQQALQVARGAITLDHPDEIERLKAVQAMDGFKHKQVITLLEQRLQKNADGSFVEPSELVRATAQDVVDGLKQSEFFYKMIEDTFFGLSLGSVLLLAAVGLAITFGVMGVINMAHGEMIMLGAYTTYVVQLLMPSNIGASLIVAVPAAFLVAGLMGVIIERGVIRFLYGRPLETLLATFGISLILQQLVRTIFSPLNRSVITPEWMSGSLEINGFLSLTYNRLYIVLFALAVLFGLMLLLKKSFFGLQMRAVTQNRAMASSMGIRTGWVDAMTFGLGSGIAGIAGVALSQLTNVGPNLGQAYIIDSFMVVVFGGVGNLWGTFVAAMGLGVANKFIEPLSGAVLAKILMLVFIILFIQRRPRGLFALKGRFVEG
ncbi:MAG TPA: urea ABC transporter permease subunit UrtB [Candidatus Kapabacteria bacterium]|nr:urea ABC transporter permease subunit UrtB [Candidatus Kapabacteria bacterium]